MKWFWLGLFFVAIAIAVVWTRSGSKTDPAGSPVPTPAAESAPVAEEAEAINAPKPGAAEIETGSPLSGPVVPKPPDQAPTPRQPEPYYQPPPPPPQNDNFGGPVYTPPPMDQQPPNFEPNYEPPTYEPPPDYIEPEPYNPGDIPPPPPPIDDVYNPPPGDE